MDYKEKEIFNYYYEKIKNKLFDEKDIFAFLILIRQYSTKSDKQFQEAADMIAHRKRNRGIFKEDLLETNENYLSKPLSEWTYEELNLKKVPNYTSLNEDKFFSELNKIIKTLGYKEFAQNIKSEIFLCIISLMQFVTYENKGTKLGETRMFVSKTQIALTTFMSPQKPMVCCALMDNIFCGKDFEPEMDAYNFYTLNPYVIKRDKNKVLFIEHEGKRL